MTYLETYFIQKTYRQPAYDVRRPPRTGPTTPANATMTPSVVVTTTTLEGGLNSGYVIIAMVYIPAPPIPWTARKPMSWSSDADAPHPMEAARKTTKDVQATVFLPKASENLAMATANPCQGILVSVHRQNLLHQGLSRQGRLTPRQLTNFCQSVAQDNPRRCSEVLEFFRDFYQHSRNHSSVDERKEQAHADTDIQSPSTSALQGKSQPVTRTSQISQQASKPQWAAFFSELVHRLAMTGRTCLPASDHLPAA